MFKLAKLARPFLAATILLPVAAAAQEHPNLARGASAFKSYHAGSIDTVDLFSGALHLSIPIGSAYPVNGSLAYQLVLSYNSKVWDNNDAHLCSDQFGESHHCVESLPTQTANAGMGFTLTLGELLPPSSAKNDSNFWVYLGADGGRHTFYDRLHENENPVAGVCFTRDNTYLRLKGVGGCVQNTTGLSATVEFPDGTYQTFTRGQNALPFQLSSIRDRFNNQISVTPLTSPEPGWQLYDSHRTQTVYFKTSSITQRQIVDRVVLTTAAGLAGTWRFNYRPSVTSTIQRSGNDEYTCWVETQNGDPCPNANVNVDLLASITLPDNSSYTMDSYETAVRPSTDGGPDVPGVLRQLKLPTGGILQWDYQSYEFVQRNVLEPDARLMRDVIGRSAGVRAKRYLQADGSCVAGLSPACDWTYVLTPGAHPTYDRKLVVRSPLGYETVHWFAENDEVWNYGLPMKSTTDGAGRFLSRQIFQGGEGTGLKRSMYLRYEADSAQYSEHNRNARVAGQRTTFDDDGGRWSTVDSSNWDGVGHYRQTDTSGIFDSGNTRSEFVDYKGMPGVSATWFLGAFVDHKVTEGASVVRDFSCFDATTGALKRRRTLKDPTALSADDLLVDYSRDSSGNISLERYYGGDTPAGLNPAPAPTEALVCSSSLPASLSYSVQNTYQYGALRQSQHVGANFFDVNNFQIDPNTGLTLTSRDSAEVPTSYEYDTMNRLTLVKPTQDAWVKYDYSNAAGAATPAKVRMRRFPNNSTAGELTDEEVHLDPFGRVAKERRWMPVGNWSKRVTRFNAMGWPTFSSEWAADSLGDLSLPSTEFRSYDAFGRPTTIRPPDGSAHDVTLAYLGVRSVSRTTKVATANGSESSSTTTEVYDRQGRLFTVQEPSGAGGALVTTTYGYDAGNRLNSVSTSGSTQTRTFHYDPLGFLRWENHPEKTANGYGEGHDVDYALYDARGHAGRKVDGPNDLRFTYDSAERLTDVYTDVYTPARLLKKLSYGAGITASDRSRGRLKTAERYNYPLFGGTTRTVVVKDVYTYGGASGRVSARQTSLKLDADTNEYWNLGLQYDALGDVSRLTYPDCAFPACATSPRAVDFAHARGGLTGVTGYAPATGYADSLSYHPNGALNQVTHANGVVDTQGVDPNSMQRPRSIGAARGTTALWSSGTYTYDGTGNVKKIGTSYFVYDGVSRLVDGHVYDGPIAPGSGTPPKYQTYSYDVFGNITAIGGTSGRSTPTSSVTNRLTGASYDSAGNLKAWNGQSYEYDALNQMTRFCSSTPCPGGAGEEWLYMYNADDERLWSFKVGASPRFDRFTLRGLDGKVLREYANSGYTWSLKTDYIYRDGLLLAEESAWSGQHHFHLDHLGTPRLITGSNGAAGGAWTGSPSPTCKPAPGDYNGDGNAEYSLKCGPVWHFYKDDGSYLKGIWTGGQDDETPVPADYDGDGDDEPAIFRGGAWIFYDYYTGAEHGIWVGVPGNCIPAAGDFTGDGRADVSLKCGGTWYFWAADGTYLKGIWTGAPDTKLPVPGDYDGDFDDDMVMSDGVVWDFWEFATGAYVRSVTPTFVNGTKRPAPLDYDGDGTTDLATMADGAWHFFRDDGTHFEGIWTGGVAGDLTVAKSYRGDRTEEPTLFRGGAWLHFSLAGTPVAFHAYYPFGEEVTSPTLDVQRMKFTGHERDLGNPSSAADDLDYMHARHESPLTGRFLSTDRAAANPKKPQTWNRYSYVANRPLTFVDPTGELALHWTAYYRARNYVLRKLGIRATDLTKPGPYAAAKGVPATVSRKPSVAAREALKKQGDELGCTHCGTKVFGTKKNDPVGDHHPPISLAKDGESFQLFPQCLSCSNKQGGQISAFLRKNGMSIAGLISGWFGLAAESQALMQSEAERLEQAVQDSHAMDVRNTQYDMIEAIDE